MKLTKHLLSKLLMIAVSLGMLLALSIPMMGQEPLQAPKPITVGNVKITGVPDDWTHHHLVFSNPGTEEDAIQNATYVDWLKVVSDPRYVIQQLKRRLPAEGPYAEEVARILETARAEQSATAEETATQGTAATDTIAAEGRPVHPEAPTRKAPPVTSTKKKPKMSKDWSVGLGAGTPMTAVFPAKWSFSTTQASCANDFVIYVTGVAGSSTQASIIAYNNLYSGCGGTVPQAYWAYNTTGTANTSPVLSVDGAQVAFVQYNSSNVSSVVLLKWKTPGGSLGGPASPTSVSVGSYRACTAPCMTTLTLTNNTQDSYSNAFYDYSNDAIYVGDNSGYLHKFTGVFSGTPSSTEASGFPVHLINSGGSTYYALTSPIRDPNSGTVMVGSMGGVAFWVTSTGTVSSTTAVTSGCPGTNGVNDAPLVDSGAQREYVFFDDYYSGGKYYDYIIEYNLANSPPTTVASEATGYSEYQRPSWPCTVAPFFSGDFDNVYYQSSNQTGNLFVVGDSEGPSELYRLPISANTMGAPVTVSSSLSDGTYYVGRGSPVTEFCNNGANACVSNGTKTTSGTDYIFFSVLEGTLSGCTDDQGGSGSHGCVISYDVTTPSSPTTTTPLNITAPTANPRQATGGIVVDNALSSPSGTSQIYFNTRTTSGSCGTSGTGICATQALQSAP